MATFQERGQQILNEHFFSKTSSLTLTFDHVTCISIRVIYSLGVSIVPSLETFKQRGCRVKRYWMDIIYTKTSSLTLTFDHVTWNLLSRSIHYTKFEIFQAKGSRYIEHWHHLVYRPTERPFIINIDWMSNWTTVNHSWNENIFILIIKIWRLSTIFKIC